MLARLGFDWHETGLAIERLRDRRWIVSPVIGFALHPSDLASPRVLAAAARAIRRLARTRPRSRPPRRSASPER